MVLHHVFLISAEAAHVAFHPRVLFAVFVRTLHMEIQIRFLSSSVGAQFASKFA